MTRDESLSVGRWPACQWPARQWPAFQWFDRRTLACLLFAGLACSFISCLSSFSYGAMSSPPPQEQRKAQQDRQAQAQKAEGAAPQEASKEAGKGKPSVPEHASRTYDIRNGTDVYQRTEESDRKKTADGEVETERVRMPSWNGDNRLLMERETRTKTLPDGTVEKEYVLKNPDGANHLVPIEIVRERITKSGDKTSIERETLKPDAGGEGWTPVRKEHVDETGSGAATRSVKEVRQPSAAGDWSVVDREVTSTKSSPDGKESHSVRQLPDAYGRLADYEVKDERTSKSAGAGETHEVTLSRRDFAETDHPKFYLVQRTVTHDSTADGKQVVTSTTESDLVSGGASRNIRSDHPQVVEEKTEVSSKGQGAETKTVNVKERNAGDPTEVRPSYHLIQETDKDGHVREVFIPSGP